MVIFLLFVKKDIIRYNCFGDYMKSIKENTTNEITINKSKFICKLIKISNEEDVKKYLSNIKNEYKDATHYCYAYIIDNTKRFNDDGEPGGTAGMPILHVLEGNELNHILCVVIRYFGGIKLGAGGLVRAYTKAVTKALEISNIITLTEGQKITIEFSYNKAKYIDSLLKNIEIINKEYLDNITYTILISNQKYYELESLLIENTLNITKKESLFI
jgi:uncharacterized YigZ family protein